MRGVWDTGIKGVRDEGGPVKGSQKGPGDKKKGLGDEWSGDEGYGR